MMNQQSSNLSFSYSQLRETIKLAYSYFPFIFLLYSVQLCQQLQLRENQLTSIFAYKYFKQRKLAQHKKGCMTVFLTQGLQRSSDFIFYIDKQTMSGENYIQHHLNNSKTKEAHVFPKEERFTRKNRLATDAIYHLPSTQNKRTTCFGFGNKISLTNKTSSPPPTSYQLPSDFERKDLRNITSLGEGRDKVYFGSFIWQTLKRTKNLPSPNKYDIQIKKTKIGGNLGQRIKTDYDLKYRRQIPGPGTYKLNATQIGNGTYYLSTYKNNTSPRYFSEIAVKQTIQRAKTSTLCYDVQQKEVGKYVSSKYKNNMARTFSKAKRPGLYNKHLLFTPGFKYRRFSEFNGFPEK